jgi:hypothetical protein
MEEEADVAVEMALLRQAALPESERAVLTVPTKKRGNNMENTPEMDLIDQVLAGRSLISMKPQAMTSYTEAQKKSIEELPQRMEELEQLQQSNREAKQLPPREETPPRVVPPPPPVQAVSAVPLRPLPPKQAPQVKVAPKSVPPPAPVAAAAVTAPKSVAPPAPVPVAPKSNGRLLTGEEMELAGQSLQMLVKHRGGGPFGAGRLSSIADVNKLEDLLQRTMGMLCKADMVTGTVSAPVKTTVAAVQEKIPVKVAPQQVKGYQPAVTAVQPPAPVPVKVVQAPASAPSQDDAPLTIAQGLDSFLLAPNQSSFEELSGLRDGLIQCLYMVQQELGTRPGPSGPEEVEQVSSNNDSSAVDRMMKLNAPSMSSGEEASVASEIPLEQDVKLALGLLLKHRGGPGFGHGRLVGRELDLMAAKLR